MVFDNEFENHTPADACENHNDNLWSQSVDVHEITPHSKPSGQTLESLGFPSSDLLACQTEGPIEKPTNKPATGSAEAPQEKPSVKPNDKPVSDRTVPSEKPQAKPSDKPADGSGVMRDRFSDCQIRRATDGRYFVTGPDGREREFVLADDNVQTPAGPTRALFDGGGIDNRSGRPILAIGKGVPHPGNQHGEGYLRVVPAGTVTDASRTDFDGVITDPRFQPVVLPDGRVLMPRQVDQDAQMFKISDRNIGIVRPNGSVENVRPALPPRGDSRQTTVGEEWHRALRPETREQRRTDVEAARRAHEEWARQFAEANRRMSQWRGGARGH